ncbi:ABC transporter permease, partial [Streptomyces katsurahamanus]|nr:ABC transporter permease [Streptomyces katsurahamanus]
QVVAGALLAAGLALLVEGALAAADRLLDPARRAARTAGRGSAAVPRARARAAA